MASPTIPRPCGASMNDRSKVAACNAPDATSLQTPDALPPREVMEGGLEAQRRAICEAQAILKLATHTARDLPRQNAEGDPPFTSADLRTGARLQPPQRGGGAARARDARCTASAQVVQLAAKETRDGRKRAPAELAPREQLQYLAVHWFQLSALAREGIVNTAACVLGDREVYPVLHRLEQNE